MKQRPLFLIFLLSLLSAAVPAFGQAYFNGTTIIACPGAEQKIVLVRVTNCIQLAIVQATDRFLTIFTNYMMPITMSFIVLVMIFFGVRLLMGEGQLTRKTMALLLKIGAVLLFANNFGGWMMYTFEASGQLQSVIVNALPFDAKCTAAQYALADPAAYISANGIRVWAMLDCILGRLFGYGPNLVITSSIFGLLGSIAGSGTFGIITFFLGIATLLSIVFFVLRAIFVFLVAYMLIGFLIIISPLVIPMMLLGVTKPMFDVWVSNLISAIAMPGFVFAYLCLVMPIIDDTIEGNGPIALMKVLGSDAQITSRYRAAAQKCSMPVRNFDPSFTQARPEINMPAWFNSPLANIINPSMSSGSDFCYKFSTSSVDFGERTLGYMWDIGISLIKMMLTLILLTMLMKSIPQIAYAIFQGGSGFLSAVSNPMPLEEQFKGKFAATKDSLIKGSGSGVGGMLDGFLRK